MHGNLSTLDRQRSGWTAELGKRVLEMRITTFVLSKVPVRKNSGLEANLTNDLSNRLVQIPKVWRCVACISLHPQNPESRGSKMTACSSMMKAVIKFPGQESMHWKKWTPEQLLPDRQVLFTAMFGQISCFCRVKDNIFYPYAMLSSCINGYKWSMQTKPQDVFIGLEYITRKLIISVR